MKKNSADIVRYGVDPADMVPLTGAQKAELAALAARPDSDIDYSDIPPLPESFWQHAERGRFYKPVKEQITARVDADVLAWLKSQGKGYQARLNAILRREMLASIAKHRGAESGT